LEKKAVWKTVALSWYWTILALVGMMLVLFIVGFFSRRFVSPALFMSAGGGFLIVSFLTFTFSEVLVNLLMQAKTARKEDHPDFIEVAEELFRERKLWVYPRLYVMKMDVPNAMAYGMGFPGFSAIAITQPLYKLLSKAELKSVVAHELAHIRCKDVGLLTTIGLVTGSVEKLRQLFLSGKTTLGRGPFAFVFAGMLWIVSKILLGFLRAAISQERELAADALGAYYSGSPNPLIRALRKLSKTSKKSEKHVLSDLMVSHPGMDERIESLQALKQRNYVPVPLFAKLLIGVGVLAFSLLLTFLLYTFFLAS